MTTLAQRRKAAHTAAHRLAEINRVIAETGISQRQIAETAEMGQPHVNRILRGYVAVPTFWTLLRIEKAVRYYARMVADQRR